MHVYVFIADGLFQLTQRSSRHRYSTARRSIRFCAPWNECSVDSAFQRNRNAAIEAILKQNHLVYVRVNSEHLDAMHPSQMQAYRLLIVPGGNFVDMGNSLTADTTAKVHDAVTSGLNYLGICAGAFLAGSYPAPYKSFDLTAGVKFGFYSAEMNGVRKASLRITTAEGPALDQYWEDGPELSGWGDAVAAYPDGKPAVAEGFAGNGWVILTGDSCGSA